jgi:hypothetical protein
MAGLLHDAGAGKLSPDSIQQQFKIPPEYHTAYTKACVAGMKLLFDASTHDMVSKYLDKPGSIGLKIGKGIADVVLFLYSKSNKTLPPQVLVPTGLYLTSHALDYVKKTGQFPITPKDEGEAVQAMLGFVLEKFHIDPNKLMAAGEKSPTGAALPQTPDAHQTGA